MLPRFFAGECAAITDMIKHQTTKSADAPALATSSCYAMHSQPAGQRACAWLQYESYACGAHHAAAAPAAAAQPGGQARSAVQALDLDIVAQSQ